MGANRFKGAEAGKALGDAIATNTVLKELDISGGLLTSQQCDVEFVKEFSVGLGANGALTSLNISNNHLAGGQQIGGFESWETSKYAPTDMSGNTFSFLSVAL